MARQRDGRRLFRHAAPGCFPDLKGALARRDETASCRPSAGPNVTPEPNEKSRVWQAICSRQTKKPQDTLQILARRDETASCRPVPGPNVTPEPNEKIKGVAGTSTVPGTETKPQDTLQIRKTPWHGVTKQPPAVPLPGPNVTPEPNEKINQGSGRQLFQAHKPSHKTPFKSGKHPGTARRNSLLPSQTSLLNRMKKSRVWQAIFQAHKTGHKTPFKSENTLARRDETFQAHKTSHKTPFKSGKHPGTA